MQLVRITDSGDDRLAFIQALYESSFPLEERRVFQEVKQRLSDSAMQLMLAVTSDHIPAGFIIYWQFVDFIFVEHLAVSPECRSQGYGEQIMQSILSHAGSCCILEVEHPHDLPAEKRIAFYHRLGFHTNDVSYQQPPYHANGKPLPMLLLSKPLLPASTLQQLIDAVKQTVYHIIN